MKLPALPPRSGCRVCGASLYKLCPECAQAAHQLPLLERQEKCVDCGADMAAHGCSAWRCLSCMTKGSTAKPMSLEEQTRMVEEMDRDNEAGIRRIFRRAA